MTKPLPASARLPAPTASSASAPVSPSDWDEIGAGSIVLARAHDEEAWHEAIVVAVQGETLRLRWRGSPRAKLIIRQRTELALLPVTAH